MDILSEIIELSTEMVNSLEEDGFFEEHQFVDRIPLKRALQIAMQRKWEQEDDMILTDKEFLDVCNVVSNNGIGKTIEAKPSPSSSGEQVAQASSEVSKGQREQLKPTGVNVINMEKTNNKIVAINQTKVTDKHQGKAADTLIARAA